MSKPEKRNFRLKIHDACGKDDLRPVMQHVYFDNGYMYATDAHIGIKAAVQHFSDFDQSEVSILNGKYLHKNAFKKILACDQVVVTEEGIKDMLTQDVYKFSAYDGKFPNMEAVFPQKSEPISEIGVAPPVASRLLKILTTQELRCIKLSFSRANRVITVTGTGEHVDTFKAILMPVMLAE